MLRFPHALALAAGLVATALAGCQLLLTDSTTSSTGSSGGAGSTSASTGGDKTTSSTTTSSQASSSSGATSSSSSSQAASSSSSGMGLCTGGMKCDAGTTTPTFKVCGPVTAPDPCPTDPAGPLCTNYCASIESICQGQAKQYTSHDQCCAVCAFFAAGPDTTNNACCRADALSPAQPPGGAALCTVAGPMGTAGITPNKCGTQVHHACELFIHGCAEQIDPNTCTVASCEAQFGVINTPEGYVAGASNMSDLGRIVAIGADAVNGKLDGCGEGAGIACP
ncbi:MAG: hypothetical protein U0414_17860 [Polyangiaceae bacterium]